MRSSLAQQLLNQCRLFLLLRLSLVGQHCTGDPTCQSTTSLPSALPPIPQLPFPTPWPPHPYPTPLSFQVEPKRLADDAFPSDLSPSWCPPITQACILHRVGVRGPQDCVSGALAPGLQYSPQPKRPLLHGLLTTYICWAVPTHIKRERRGSGPGGRRREDLT